MALKSRAPMDRKKNSETKLDIPYFSFFEGPILNNLYAQNILN